MVPVKRFDRAKQRLSGVLDSAGRAALAAAMLGDVLEQLCGTGGLAGVLVVTSDAEATAIAERFGAIVLTDPADSGVNDAVAHGVRKLNSLGASSGVIAPSDIPFVTSAELGIVLAALESNGGRPHARHPGRRHQHSWVVAACRDPARLRARQLRAPLRAGAQPSASGHSARRRRPRHRCAGRSRPRPRLRELQVWGQNPRLPT